MLSVVTFVLFGTFPIIWLKGLEYATHSCASSGVRFAAFRESVASRVTGESLIAIDLETGPQAAGIRDVTWIVS
jgi:hypothetical protein